MGDYDTDYKEMNDKIALGLNGEEFNTQRHDGMSIQ